MSSLDAPVLPQQAAGQHKPSQLGHAGPHVDAAAVALQQVVVVGLLLLAAHVAGGGPRGWRPPRRPPAPAAGRPGASAWRRQRVPCGGRWQSPHARGQPLQPRQDGLALALLLRALCTNQG